MRKFILSGLPVASLVLQVQAIELRLVRSGALAELDAITSHNGEYSISVDWNMAGIGSLIVKKIYFKKDDRCLWEKENPLYISYYFR